MWKNKIVIEPWVRQKIQFSPLLSDEEKNNFLRYIAYFTESETQELLLLI